jgi:hypothetical protein
VAARGDAGVGDDFLEAVEHGGTQVFSCKFSVFSKAKACVHCCITKSRSLYLILKT